MRVVRLLILASSVAKEESVLDACAKTFLCEVGLTLLIAGSFLGRVSVGFDGGISIVGDVIGLISS
jgi:uncharacterized membrane protein